MNGRRIITASWWGTALLAATTATAVVSPGWRAVGAAVACGLFAAGVGVFAWAYAVAVARSRHDVIGIGGLFFLAGDAAPAAVRRSLMGALGGQVAIGLLGAILRPFTPLAFGILAPVFGLALAGLWGARHGRFDPRAVN